MQYDHLHPIFTSHFLMVSISASVSVDAPSVSFAQYDLLLPPANEVCEGCVFTRVCLSWAGTPRAGTPHKGYVLHVSVCPRGGEYLGRHTPQRLCFTRVCLSTGGGEYLGRYTPRAGTPPRQVHPPGAVHAGRFGQQAGSTHPTGMYSCCLGNFSIIQDEIFGKSSKQILLCDFSQFLPPKTKLGQGYVFTRVCDSVHSVGGSPGPHPGGSASLHDGIHSPPTATAAGGTHPTGMHSCTC